MFMNIFSHTYQHFSFSCSYSRTFSSSALNVLRRLYTMLWLAGWRKHGLRDIFAKQVKRRGRDAVAVMHLEDKWTFGDLDDYSNRVGNFLLAKNIPHQKNIVLFMETEPRYIAIWLGAAKVRH